MMSGTFGVFENEALLTGDEESRRRAREDLRRQQRMHFAEGSSWPRLDFADLRFARLHVEHMPSNQRYRIVRGEIADAIYAPAVTAWFIRDGEVVFLEPAR